MPLVSGVCRAASAPMLSHGGSRLNASKPEANPKTSCPKTPKISLKTKQKNEDPLRVCFFQFCQTQKPFFQPNQTSEYRIASQGSEVFRPPRWPEVHQKFTRIFYLKKQPLTRRYNERACEASTVILLSKPGKDDKNPKQTHITSPYKR
jgi:hypothetical protein